MPGGSGAGEMDRSRSVFVFILDYNTLFAEGFYRFARYRGSHQAGPRLT